MKQIRLTEAISTSRRHMNSGVPCRWCDRAFVKNTDWHIYCSTSCRQKAYRHRRKTGTIVYKGIEVHGELIEFT